MFNEGYAAREDDRLVRAELCDEAIRLGRLLATLMPDDAETAGLLALMLLHDSRRAARTDADGAVRLARPTRTARAGTPRRIEEGTRALDRALRLRRPGPYQLQAAIAALHATAPTADDTDWPQIAALYGRLSCAHALAGRPGQPRGRGRHGRTARAPASASSTRCRATPRLAGYQPFHAARADLLRRAGDGPGAAAAYGRAIELSTNAVERRELERRRSALAAG